LQAPEIGLLATVGKVKGVMVWRRPRIGLLSTGNELVETGVVELSDGKIRDSNKLMLKALLRSAAVASEVKDFGVVQDEGSQLDEAMRRAV